MSLAVYLGLDNCPVIGYNNLNLKKVREPWFAQINMDYRALAREEAGTFVWPWLGM